MSPDDVFAAQMWPWPDPLLKRDPMGRVIFVNAAFLQLYGGRVENWAGHPVQGWPAPNPQGLPYRFETRAGEGEGEIIYDWVEVTMADGNALALARDVTVFRQEPLISEPIIEPQMAQPAASAFIPPAPQQAPAAAPVQQAAPEIAIPPAPQPIQHEPVEPEPVQHAPIIEPAAPAPAPVASFEPEAFAPSEFEPDAFSPDPVEPAQPEAAPAPEIPQAASDPQPPAQVQAVEDKPREFERRALPIENGDAVLGSNWRDAVIAKAIGATDNTPQEDPVDAAPVAIETQEDVSTGGGLHILLAEDNAINALLTRTLLEAEGCTVETVEDGVEAVKAMENGNYDLIFMDMRMPNMDGLEATRKIRAMGAKTEKLPIIALTANAFDDDRNACFDSGMNDFMTKPVSAEELTAMVESWTKKRAEPQSNAA